MAFAIRELAKATLQATARDKSRSRHSIAELGFQRGDSMIESDRKELEQEIVALGQTVATMLADLQLELCSQGKG